MAKFHIIFKLTIIKITKIAHISKSGLTYNKKGDKVLMFKVILQFFMR